MSLEADHKKEIAKLLKENIALVNKVNALKADFQRRSIEGKTNADQVVALEWQLGVAGKEKKELESKIQAAYATIAESEAVAKERASKA